MTNSKILFPRKKEVHIPNLLAEFQNSVKFRRLGNDSQRVYKYLIRSLVNELHKNDSPMINLDSIAGERSRSPLDDIYNPEDRKSAQMFVVLRSAIDWAIDTEKIPPINVKWAPSKVETKDPEYYTEKEVQALKIVANEKEYWRVVEFILETGTNFKTALRLEYNDLSKQHGLYLFGEPGKWYVANERATEIIDETKHSPAIASAKHLVFRNEVGAKMNVVSVYNHLKIWCDRAQVKYRGTKALRSKQVQKVNLSKNI